jgi:hypothetical protein
LKRGILDIRLAAVLFIFLMGSVSLIGANQRAEANEVINATCSSCGSSSSAAQVLNTTVLEGEEKNKAVAAALSSEDYKNVKKLFPESVYAPLVDQAKAGIMNLQFNGTKYDALAVFVPFEVGAGFSAGIVFMPIRGHTLALGVVVNLQYKTPVFAAMSMDGEAIVIPLQAGSPCCSCSLSGPGVSPMVDQCSGDSDCWNLYGPGYCCVDCWCVYCGPPPPSPGYDCDYCKFICEHWISGYGYLIMAIIICALVCFFIPPACDLCLEITLLIAEHVEMERLLGHDCDTACADYCP